MLYYGAEYLVCPDRGSRPGRMRGSWITVPRRRTNDLPEGCYRTVRKEAALGAFDKGRTARVPSANQSKNRQGRSTRFVTASTLFGSSQLGFLKPPQVSVYSWHSLDQDQDQDQDQVAVWTTEMPRWGQRLGLIRLVSVHWPPHRQDLGWTSLT